MQTERVIPSAWPVFQAGWRGAVEPARVAVAECGVGRGVGCLAQHRTGKTGGSVLGDVLVEGEVAAVAAGAGGEQAERAGLSRPGAGLQDEMVAGPESIHGVGLFIGGGVQERLREKDEEPRGAERGPAFAPGLCTTRSRMQPRVRGPGHAAARIPKSAEGDGNGQSDLDSVVRRHDRAARRARPAGPGRRAGTGRRALMCSWWRSGSKGSHSATARSAAVGTAACCEQRWARQRSCSA